MVFHKVVGGTVREVFRVEDKTQSYAIKIAKESRSSFHEYRLLSKGLDLPAPRSVCISKLTDQLSVTWEEWIEGIQALPGTFDIESGVNVLKQIHGLCSGRSITATESISGLNRRFENLWKEPMTSIQGQRPLLDLKWKQIRKSISMESSQRKVLVHGDFHPGNLIKTASGKWIVIDWERWGIGHPFQDLADLVRGIRGGPSEAVKALQLYGSGKADSHLFEAFCILKVLDVICWKEIMKRNDIATDLAILDKWIR